MDDDELDVVLDRIDEIENYLETREEKIRAYEELAAGVEVSPSVDAHLFAFHLASGNEDAAMAIEGRLRQLSREVDLGQDYAWIGESFEVVDRLRDALRWYSMANRDIEPDDVDSLEKQALIGRLRVREALGLPEDAYDVQAREWREFESRRWADELE